MNAPSASGVQALARSAREEAARDSFALARVTELIQRYAKAGFRQVMVTPRKALCLQGTETARATVQALTDLGYDVEWEVAFYEKTDRFNPAGVPTFYASMVITWEWHKPVRWSVRGDGKNDELQE